MSEVRPAARYRFGGEEDIARLDKDSHRYDAEAMQFARERLASGDRFVLGEIDNTVVFYGWLSFGEMDLDYRNPKRIAPDCAYSYKLFTVSEWRGHKLLAGYYEYVAPILFRMGYMRILCWTDASNRSSLKAHSRSGFRPVGAIWEVRIWRKVFRIVQNEHCET